jgi:glycosyltransferase involved in cell wall biosynthesis
MHFYESCGADKNKIEVLPDAVDLNDHKNISYFSKKEKIKIGYIGSLYKGRGIEIIIELCRIFPGYDFVIVGGLDSEVAQRQDLTRGIKNISFLGSLPYREIPAYMEKFDILLMPYQRSVAISGNRGDTSRWMSPLKMFEYMASGKPIIASDLAVLREVLKDRVNCLLVTCDDVGKWKEAIEYLLNNSEFAISLGKTARREAEEKYSWDIRAKRILEIAKN